MICHRQEGYLCPTANQHGTIYNFLIYEKGETNEYYSNRWCRIYWKQLCVL